MKVYGDSGNFRTQKVMVAAKLAKKQIQMVQSSPSALVSPFGIVPALEDGKIALFGAESVSKYLLRDSEYFPKKLENEVDQWLFWGEGHLLPNVLCYVLPSISFANVGLQKLEEAKTEFYAQLVLFNNLLADKTFFVGERFSFADVSIALDLLPAYQYVLGDEARAKIPNINRWFMTIMNQPAVKEVVPDLKFISKPSTFNEEEYKKVQAKFTSNKASQSQKPVDKKPSKKEDQEEMDAADEALAAQPKFVDPLSALPPGTFVMDAFKRVYSNEDTATKAIPYFWENFDRNNYSIWYSEYKYPEELKQVFMSCNLITGMFQRLEKLKKHGFGSMCLFGTDNNSSISGIWIWRGQELAFELCPDWQVDYDVYSWKKLDPTVEADKKTVNEYLLWEGEFGGKKFNQGKIFK